MSSSSLPSLREAVHLPVSPETMVIFAPDGIYIVNEVFEPYVGLSVT
jgi:hypothetical protein